MSRDSLVSISMGYGLDSWGSIPGRSKIFLFSIVSRPALGPTQFSIQWVPMVLSQWVRQSGCEADNSHPSSADVKNDGVILHSPLYLDGIVLN
jgi:hypothetical protein